MGLNIKLIKHFDKTSTSDVAHSSGYANAQSGSNFGAASTETFTQRRAVEENRQVVQGYNQAMVAQRVNTTPRAMTYQEELAASAARKAALRAKYAKDKQDFEQQLKNIYLFRK